MSKRSIKKRKKWLSAIAIGLFLAAVAGASFILIKTHKTETPPSQYKIPMPASFRLTSQKHICAVGQSSGCYQRNGDSFPGVGGGWQYTYQPENTRMTVDEAYRVISNSVENAGYHVSPRKDSNFWEGRVIMYAPDQRVNISVEIYTQNNNEVPTTASLVREIEVDAYQ